MESKDKPQTTTSEPATPSTTSTPAEAVKPSEPKYDANGFPAAPQPNQEFTDSNGQNWGYVPLFGWVKDGGPNTMEDFPDNYGEIGTGEQILY